MSLTSVFASGSLKEKKKRHNCKKKKKENAKTNRKTASRSFIETSSNKTHTKKKNGT